MTSSTTETTTTTTTTTTPTGTETTAPRTPSGGGGGGGRGQPPPPPHTPPESNDGTQSSSEQQQKLNDELARKLAHYNALNVSFKSDQSSLSLSTRLESARRRLRTIHSSVFNRHLAAYLAANNNTRPDQVVGDEIAYEIGRRREDDEEDDDNLSSDDDDDDDDDNISLTSSSSSEQPDDDQLVYARENDTTTSTGDVNFVDNNSELNLLNNLCADEYWSMQRVKLGSEWTRLQTKMAYLRAANERVNKYVSSEREIEKLSKSLKDSIRKTFSVSSRSQDDVVEEEDDDRSTAVDSTDNSVVNSDEENNDDEEETSRRVVRKQERRVEGRRCGGLKQVVKFDDELVLKSFYVTLMHFRTSLFKETCLCGGSNEEEETTKRGQQSSMLEATKSCIFCHMFKKYDSDLVDRCHVATVSHPNTITTSPPTTPLTSTSSSTQQSYSIRADERVIKLYHSYCKQPKYGDKLQWATARAAAAAAASKRHITAPLRPRNHDDEMTAVVVDEYQDLGWLVNERLNKLFGSGFGRGENRENEQQQPQHETVVVEQQQQLKQPARITTVKDQFDEIEIDPGYEISLDDIKKLPDFSYDELKFLCDDDIWQNGDDEENDDPKTKKLSITTTTTTNTTTISRKRKEHREEEHDGSDEETDLINDEQKRLRLDSNR